MEDLENLYGRYAETAFDLIASYEDNDDDMKFPRFLSASFMDFLYAEEETMLSIATVVEKDPIEHWWDAPRLKELQENAGAQAENQSAEP